jgi:hypothetical protein
LSGIDLLSNIDSRTNDANHSLNGGNHLLLLCQTQLFLCQIFLGFGRKEFLFSFLFIATLLVFIYFFRNIFIVIIDLALCLLDSGGDIPGFGGRFPGCRIHPDIHGVFNPSLDPIGSTHQRKTLFKHQPQAGLRFV